MRIALHEPGGPDGDPYPFGNSRVTELFAAALRMAGHEVDTGAAGTKGGPTLTRDGPTADRQVEEIVVGFKSFARPRPDVWISSRIDRRCADRIGRAVCTALGIPHVLLQPTIEREGDPDSEGAASLLAAITAANATFAVSGAYASAIAGRSSAHIDQVIVLSPFIDFDAVLPAINNRRAHRALLAVRHQLPTDAPWLIAAGPMATRDDVESYRTLAQAMMPLSNMKWTLIAAGAGSRRPEIEALFGRMPVRQHRVIAVDTQAELLTLLACGDLFIWPSMDDSPPLPAIEAQAVGMAVVAGRTAAAQDVVADGRTGMLAKPGNAASLANAIGFLLRHPEFRRGYGEQGPKWVARYFDMRAIVSQLDATLHRVVRIASPNEVSSPVRAVD